MDIYCEWDGFVWVWDRWERKWLIDLNKSGGPPSPHDESPSAPPFVFEDKDGPDDLKERWIKAK